MNKIDPKFRSRFRIKTKLLNILEFWFMDDNKQKWFVKDEDFDRQIFTIFHELYAELLPQRITDMGSGYTANIVLALIILFNQFPRNMFRNVAQAFATDHIALALTKTGVRKFLDKQLTDEYKLFFYMPLMLSENMSDQELSVRLFAFDNNAYQYAKAHFDIIKRFGRFPQRNKILGRESTEEELEFLADNKLSYFSTEKSPVACL